MKILGLDYGRAKIGIAIAEGPLAEPLKVIKIVSWEDAFQKIKKEIEREKAETIVVGLSEGEMAREQEEFVKQLAVFVSVPIVVREETLSTIEAQVFSQEAGIPQKRRKKMEDAYAATIVLQSFLDEAKIGN